MNTAVDASTTRYKLWKSFKDIVLSIAKKTCSTKIVGRYKKRTSWWNVSIKERVKIKKQRWKEYLRKRTKESFINSKKKEQRHGDEFKKAKLGRIWGKWKGIVKEIRNCFSKY